MPGRAPLDTVVVQVRAPLPAIGLLGRRPPDHGVRAMPSRSSRDRRPVVPPDPVPARPSGGARWWSSAPWVCCSCCRWCTWSWRWAGSRPRRSPLTAPPGRRRGAFVTATDRGRGPDPRRRRRPARPARPGLRRPGRGGPVDRLLEGPLPQPRGRGERHGGGTRGPARDSGAARPGRAGRCHGAVGAGRHGRRLPPPRAAFMTARRADAGQVLPLVLVYTLVAFLLVTVVVDAASVHLERNRLTSLADAAALDAASALDPGRFYQQGAGTGGGVVPVTDESVRAGVRTFLVPLPGSRPRSPGWRWRSRPAHRTARRCRSRWSPSAGRR